MGGHEMPARVETKVAASSTAAGLSGLTLWALGAYVFHGDVPVPVQGFLLAVIPSGSAFVAGWMAKHTFRPDLAPRGVPTK